MEEGGGRSEVAVEGWVGEEVMEEVGKEGWRDGWVRRWWRLEASEGTNFLL